MPERSPEGADSHGLAVSLEPVLRKETDGRLGTIEWFTTVLQRGGASTGRAVFTCPEQGEVDAIVKLPVGPRELRWSRALGGCPSVPGPTPRVLASGAELNGYDLGWMIIEAIHGEAMPHDPGDDGLAAILEAAASFQACAEASEPPGVRPPSPDYGAAVDRGRSRLADCGIAEPQRWNEALRKVQKKVDHLERLWALRPVNAWCHGDLHPGNAIRNGANPPVRLIDLAQVHAGHWCEDALYLERQFWGRPERIRKSKPVSMLAKSRRAIGLVCEDGYADLARVRRVLSAACVPDNWPAEGDGAYAAGALDIIEKQLHMIG
ncbi:MAG: aminoglycoside phosphotransferase family protein [Planctomycetota bacterium]